MAPLADAATSIAVTIAMAAASRLGRFDIAHACRFGEPKPIGAQTDFSGVDIVPDVVRLCAMNFHLHGAATAESPIERADALNPPFGRKQGYKIIGDDGEIESEHEEYNRPDFIKTTSNK